MRKEVLIIHAESKAAKADILRDFRESYEDAMSGMYLYVVKFLSHYRL
jgi:hypothetical protein